MKLIDVNGHRFDRLLVLGRAVGKDNSGWWLCRCDCGVEKVVRGTNLKNGRVRSCGCLRLEVCSRRGPASPHWRGGRRTQDGYALIYVLGHPRARRMRGYSKDRCLVLEHVVVMEQVLGRRMLPHETVHHKNGVRSDNRPDNLELWSSSQPPGQRIVDLVSWAKEILALYESATITAA